MLHMARLICVRSGEEHQFSNDVLHTWNWNARVGSIYHCVNLSFARHHKKNPKTMWWNGNAIEIEYLCVVFCCRQQLFFNKRKTICLAVSSRPASSKIRCEYDLRNKMEIWWWSWWRWNRMFSTRKKVTQFNFDVTHAEWIHWIISFRYFFHLLCNHVCCCKKKSKNCLHIFRQTFQQYIGYVFYLLRNDEKFNLDLDYMQDDWKCLCVRYCLRCDDFETVKKTSWRWCEPNNKPYVIISIEFTFILIDNNQKPYANHSLPK